MLAGLLFLGVLAAVSMPDMIGLMRSADDDAEVDRDPEDALRDTSEIDTDAEEATDDPAQDDQALGEDLFANPAAGQMTIDAFNPGTDTLTLQVPDEAQEFSVLDSDGTHDAILRYDTADGPVEVHFTGLAVVPVGDVFLRVSDPASPTLDADIALSQLMEDGEAAATVLEPVDPTLPDDPAEPADEDGPALEPVDPTLPDDPPEPPEPGDEGPVLYPVTDDGPAPDLADLASLLTREGGSAVGLDEPAPDLRVTGDGDDAVVLPAGGDAGTLALSEAAPSVQSGDGAVAIDLGDGDDNFTGGGGATYGFGGAGDDTLAGGAGASALFGGSGADVLTGGEADAGQTLLHGGSGDDVVIAGPAGAYLDGGEHGETAGETGDDTITGGDGADTIRGGWGADVLNGGAGNDVIDHRGTDAERIIAERHEFAWHVDGDADTLDGGAGDDILILDRGDLATGGAGEDVFWLYSDASGAGVADITDFTPGQDFLRISLNPQITAEGNVAIVASEDGLDGLVQVDGTTVAILRGAPDATATDLYVETRPDVFA